MYSKARTGPLDPRSARNPPEGFHRLEMALGLVHQYGSS